jgi:hypothetical protein
MRAGRHAADRPAGDEAIDADMLMQMVIASAMVSPCTPPLLAE